MNTEASVGEYDSRLTVFFFILFSSNRQSLLRLLSFATQHAISQNYMERREPNIFYQLGYSICRLYYAR